MEKMTKEEIDDDNIYLIDIRNELKDIEERREKILSNIQYYENKLSNQERREEILSSIENYENKLNNQENKLSNQELINQEYTAEEIDDYIYEQYTD